MQNAIKYNRLEGDIVIIVSLRKCKEDEKRKVLKESIDSLYFDKNIENKKEVDEMRMIMETEIIDSGIGISKER